MKAFFLPSSALIIKMNVIKNTGELQMKHKPIDNIFKLYYCLPEFLYTSIAITILYLSTLKLLLISRQLS